MTTFILGCVGLVLLSGLFYLIPRQRPDGADEDLQQANLEWFRLRQLELEQEGSDALQDDARLRLLEDEQQRAQPNAPAVTAGRFNAWLLLPLVALMSTALYYRLGAAPDVLIVRQLQSIDENTTPESMQALMSSIEARSAQRPDNMHYTSLLGRYYMGQNDYRRAAQAYAGLARENPEDAQALAYAAQADYLASGRQLSELARMRAEQALAVNPHQRTALGLLGMASFEQQRYPEAVEYWERLLAMESPDSESASMITGVIAEARSRMGEQPDAGEADAVAATAPTGAGVTVRVVLPEGAGVGASDTVFVLARNAGSDSRMPIAVQRLQVSQLPVTLRLDDSNSMAGQLLSAADSVVVIVQVSPDGRPGEANATWLGQAGPLAPGMDSEPLEIMLQPRG